MTGKILDEWIYFYISEVTTNIICLWSMLVVLCQPEYCIFDMRRKLRTWNRYSQEHSHLEDFYFWFITLSRWMDGH